MRCCYNVISHSAHISEKQYFPIRIRSHKSTVSLAETSTQQPKQSSNGFKKEEEKKNDATLSWGVVLTFPRALEEVLCVCADEAGVWWGWLVTEWGKEEPPPPPVPKQPAVTKEPGRPTGSSQRDGSSERSNPFWPFCVVRVLPPPLRAKLTEPEGGCASCGWVGACSHEGPAGREADRVPWITLE